MKARCAIPPLAQSVDQASFGFTVRTLPYGLLIRERKLQHPYLYNNHEACLLTSQLKHFPGKKYRTEVNWKMRFVLIARKFRAQCTYSSLTTVGTFFLHYAACDHQAAGFKRAAEILYKFMDTTADPCNDFYQYACGNYAVHYLFVFLI